MLDSCHISKIALPQYPKLQFECILAWLRIELVWTEDREKIINRHEAIRWNTRLDSRANLACDPRFKGTRTEERVLHRRLQK